MLADSSTREHGKTRCFKHQLFTDAVHLIQKKCIFCTLLLLLLNLNTSSSSNNPPPAHRTPSAATTATIVGDVEVDPVAKAVSVEFVAATCLNPVIITTAVSSIQADRARLTVCHCNRRNWWFFCDEWWQRLLLRKEATAEHHPFDALLDSKQTGRVIIIHVKVET